MPVGSNDALKAIELLELYRSKLSEITDKNLIDAIDKVINVFNSQFFIALLEIQRFYIDILSNNYLSVSDKTQETLNFLHNLKLYPSSPSSIASSGRIGSRLANDVESINMFYSSLKHKESLPTAFPTTYKKSSNNYSHHQTDMEKDSSCDTNNLYNDNLVNELIDNQLINRPIVMEAVIVKGSTGFGFSVAGGYDNPYFHLNDPGIYVTKITPGGAVDLSGSLNIDDQILSVNGINMTYLTHETAVSVLKEAGDELHLVIQRDPTLKHKMTGMGYMRRRKASLTGSTMSDSRQDSQVEKSSSQVSPDQTKTSSHNSVWVTSSKTSSVPSNISQSIKSSNSSFVSLKSRIVNLKLVKGERGLGFSIGGGKGNEHYIGDPGIYITKITESGPAASSGLIAEGDKLVQVNDFFLSDVTHEEAVKILSNTGSTVELKVLKPCKISTNFIEPYEDPLSNCQSIKDLSDSISNNNSPVKMNNSDHNHEILFDETDNNFINKSPRIIVLERPDEKSGFGFNIVGGEDEDGIFVSFVIQNGIAFKNNNIFVGDRIWQVNGIDISVATHDEAAALLKGAGKSLELLLTTDLNEYMAFESKFNWNTQKNKETNSGWFNSKSTPNLAETFNKQIYNDIIPSNDLHHDNKIDDYMRSVDCELNRESLKKNNNDTDVFESSKMYKSCKSIDIFNEERHNPKLQTKSHALNNYISHISEKENHQIFTFESNTSTTNSGTNHSGISNESGNLSFDRDINMKKSGFYVRAQFDFDPDLEKSLPSRPLSFLTSDILLIINSADPDWWQARIVEDNNENGPLGIIPSPQKLYRKEKRHKKKVNFDSQLVSKTSKKNSLPRNGKSSFIKRMQFSGMSKSVQNITEEKSYHNDFTEEKLDESKIMLYFYEPLIKITLDYIRPVVIIGPMRDKINDTLIEEHPNLFASCVPHTTRPKKPHEINGKDYYFIKDRKEMEEQVKHQEFIEAGQYKDNLYGTSISAVRDVAKFKHCVLDVSALAIKRLVTANLLPITILIKPPSVKSLCNFSSKITVAQADSQVKKAEELQSKFSHYFTAIVWEDSFSYLYNKIKSIIQSNSGSDIWVPTNQNTLTL